MKKARLFLTKACVEQTSGLTARRVGLSGMLVVLLALGFLVATRQTHAATFTISSNTNWSAIVGGPPTSADAIIITNGATLTVDVSNAVCASIQIGTTTSTNTGTLSFNSGSQVTVSGTVTVGGSGGSGRAGSINMGSGGTLVAQALAVNAAGTWTPGSGTVQLTGNNTIPIAFFTSFNNLTINGNTTTLGATITVSGNLTVSSGTLDLSTFTADRTASGGILTVSNGATLKIGGTNTFPANYATHTLSATSTVEYSGAAQSISAETYGNLRLSGTGNKTFSNSTTTIANTFTSTGGTMVPGTGTIIFTGASGSIAGSSAKVFNNLTINNGASITEAAGAGNITINGNYTNDGTFSQDTSLSTSFGGTTQSLSGAGSTTFGSVTVQGTSTLNAGSHNITVAGTFSVSSPNGTFNGGTATVTFAGSSVMGAGAGTYNFFNLTISGTLSNATNGKSFNVQGNWTNNGTYTKGIETITFNGSASQSIGGSSPTTFNNLTINNSTGVTLTVNATVSGNLGLTNGDLNTGSSTLFMGNGATSSGTTDVVGNVNRSDLNGGTTRSFGNPFVQITITVGTVSDITVNLVRSAPSDFRNALSRTYTITPNGGTSLTATLQLHYLDYELNGNTEANLELWRKDSTLGWQDKGKDPIGGSDTTNNWVKLSSVSQFSPWTLGTSAPTDVALMSFNAVSDPQGRVLLEWQTGYEVGNLGFNIYRDAGGKREQINPTLVAGSVMMVGRTPMTAGLSYAWIDKLAGPKDYALYWLEDVDASGKRTLHGPASPVAVAKLPERAESLLVSQMQTGTRGSSTERFLRPAVHAGKIASMPRDIQRQWEVAGRPGAKFLISNSGWYRVAQPQLVAAGFDVSSDPRFYQLFVDGSEIPLLINGGLSGRLDPPDSIEFYAAAVDSPVSTQRAFFLTIGAQPGRRLPQLPFADGKPSSRSSFTATLERRDRYIYLPSLNNGDLENWFGAFIYSNPYDQPLTLTQVDPDAADPAVLEVALQGLGTDLPPQPHTIRVQVNGQEAGSFSFTGTQHQVAQLSLSPRLLKEGENTVRLTGTAGAGDNSLVDWLRLSYPHRLVADQNAVVLTAQQDEQVQVSGFTTPVVRVFDVTDESSPVELGAKVEAAGGGYRVTATAQEVGERVLLVVGERAYQQAQVVAQAASSWHAASQGADVVMVVGAGLRSALEPLVALRKQQGYAVAVVEVEDAYDEFSYGQKRAQAIQDLVAATRQWKRVPKWLMLVGDASYDPKNYLGLGDWDLVPTKAVWVNTMETASDEWLGDVNGDGLAEVAVGRLPVRTVQQAQALVSKIVSYRPTTNDGAVLVADRNDGFDFEASSTAIQGLLPAGMRSQQIYRRLMDDPTASQAIIDAVNRGPKLVNYAGHGSASIWRGNLLTTNSVAQLTNGQALPVVVSMTCLNGMFIDPYATSLGEALLLSGQGGAIAVWASSAQTVAGAQAVVDQEFVRQLFQGVGPKGQPLTLGEVITRAKAAVDDGDVRRSWILLGDPMMQIQ